LRDFTKEQARFSLEKYQDPIAYWFLKLCFSKPGRSCCGYYQKWLERFPDFQSLAGATFSQIYPLWQGLGYNRRALALQKLATEVMQKYDGKLPVSPLLLEGLPGIALTPPGLSAFFLTTAR